MKRITVATAVFSISLLAVWVIFQTSSASLSKTKIDNPEIQAQSAVDEKSKAGTSGEIAVPVTGAERKVAPVFDASGAVVSNPSGIVLHPASSGVRKIAPVYDATGAVVSDPSGTILNASRP